MRETKYEIFIDGETVATNMDIDIATILIKALFEEYHEDSGMSITIQQMPTLEDEDNVFLSHETI